MQKFCVKCSSEFLITQDELDFYEKISPIYGLTGSSTKKYLIPPPVLCPDCRQQRRLAFRNERKLYMRSCDLCKQNTVSLYSPDKSLTVYCQKCWWFDKWDPQEYWRDYDFSRGFFDQMGELMNMVPRLSLINVNSENCEFNDCIFNSKNCYLCFWWWNLQDSYYVSASDSVNNTLDCWWSKDVHNSYEINNCESIYKSYYCKECTKMEFCYFCEECNWCSFCMFCYWINNRKYCIKNKQYTEEEYMAELKKINFSYSIIEYMKNHKNDFFVKKLHKYNSSFNAENSI